MNWDKIREDYPAACNQVYLNTASCGLISTQTANAQQQHFEHYLQKGGNAYSNWVELVEDTRKKAASLINVPANELLFIPNYTAGMNQVASMWQHKFKKVLLFEEDYPSVVLPWQVNGYDCHYFQSVENDIISTQIIEDHLKKVEPDILAISHVQFSSGFRIDLKKVAELCKKYGAYFLVDATQSFGAFPIDVQAQGIDVFLTSVYKWTTAGYGLGICYISPELFNGCHPFMAGNNARGQAIINEAASDLTNKKAAFETGHTNYPAMSALHSALTSIAVLGIQPISQRIKHLMDFLIGQLEAIIEETPVFHFSEQQRSGILSLNIPHQIQVALEKEKIITSFRTKGLRISAHFYNSEKDIKTLVASLSSLLAKN